MCVVTWLRTLSCALSYPSLPLITLQRGLLLCSYSFKLFESYWKPLFWRASRYLFPTNLTSKFLSRGNYDSFMRSKYFYFFNAPNVILKEFLGVKNQIFSIAKLRRSVWQLSRARLRIIAPWQHYFERLRQRFAIVCNSVSEFTDPKFKLLCSIYAPKTNALLLLNQFCAGAKHICQLLSETLLIRHLLTTISL